MLGLIKTLFPQKLRNLYHFWVAVVALVRFNFPSQKLAIIAVTGTDGKTTTATLVYHLLKSAGIRVALVTSVAAYIDDTEIDTGFHVTAPDPWPLQRLIQKMVNRHIKYLVLEVTSHGIDQHRILGIDPAISVLTNITHEHLDYHRGYGQYLATKAKLFARSPLAILNQDDASFLPVKALLPASTQVLPYSTNLFRGNLKRSIIARFPESYNQANATAAVLTVSRLGLKDPQIISGLKSFPGVKGRMEFIPNSARIKAYVDFAHTPNALNEVLTALRAQNPRGKLIAVYGSAGLRDRSKRPQMGQIGSQLADEVILTAEDPRTESVHTIIAQMYQGVTTNRGHVHRIPDRTAAINFAVSLAKPGDTLVTLGKGHEKSLCFGKIEYPWSDQQALKEALATKSLK